MKKVFLILILVISCLLTRAQDTARYVSTKVTTFLTKDDSGTATIDTTTFITMFRDENLNKIMTIAKDGKITRIVAGDANMEPIDDSTTLLNFPYEEKTPPFSQGTLAIVIRQDIIMIGFYDADKVIIYEVKALTNVKGVN